MTQMKEQNKTPPKEQNETEVAYPSDAEFKTLMIRMLRELIEYSKSIREAMKATLCEIKKNPHETSSEGEKARIRINDLKHKEEINSQPE